MEWLQMRFAILTCILWLSEAIVQFDHSFVMSYDDLHPGEISAVFGYRQPYRMYLAVDESTPTTYTDNMYVATPTNNITFTEWRNLNNNGQLAAIDLPVGSSSFVNMNLAPATPQSFYIIAIASDHFDDAVPVYDAQTISNITKPQNTATVMVISPSAYLYTSFVPVNVGPSLGSYVNVYSVPYTEAKDYNEYWLCFLSGSQGDNTRADVRSPVSTIRFFRPTDDFDPYLTITTDLVTTGVRIAALPIPAHIFMTSPGFISMAVNDSYPMLSGHAMAVRLINRPAREYYDVQLLVAPGNTLIVGGTSFTNNNFTGRLTTSGSEASVLCDNCFSTTTRYFIQLDVLEFDHTQGPQNPGGSSTTSAFSTTTTSKSAKGVTPGVIVLIISLATVLCIPL